MEQSKGLVRQVQMMGSDASDGSGLHDPLLTRPPARTEHDLEQLYTDHNGRLRALAAAVTFDRTVADEIMHDAFAAFVTRSTDVRDPIAYLQRSVVNLAITHVRRRHRAGKLPVHRIEHTTIPEIDNVWHVLEDLSPRQRAVVVLRFYEDLTYEQIADALGIPVGSVKSTLHRALSVLKERL